MKFCNTENVTGRRVIQSGYYNHGKHGKHGRNTPLLLISVSSIIENKGIYRKMLKLHLANS